MYSFVLLLFTRGWWWESGRLQPRARSSGPLGGGGVHARAELGQDDVGGRRGRRGQTKMLTPQIPTATKDGEDDHEVEDQRVVEQGEQLVPLLPMPDVLAEVLILPQ